jgi:hypothetical protein
VKYLIYILLIPFLSIGQFYKYSTIYGGGSFNSTMQSVETYTYNNNTLEETTIDNGFNYRYFIGVKKLSRYKFENKPKFYYDGKEENATIYRSSVGGLEYLLQYEQIKDRGTVFNNHDIWLRYLGKNTSTKLQSSNNGYVGLSYKSLDVRFKADFKRFQATLGCVLRYHPIYGLNPFKNDFPNYNDYELVAQQLGYTSEFYFIDTNNNGYLDRLEQSFYRWMIGNDTVAQNTAQFMEYYSTIPSRYNRQKLNELGNQLTLSPAVGLSYYLNLEKFFILAYGNYFFKGVKITEYGSDAIDYDFGLITNLKITRAFSLYTQLEYLNYFNKENYTINLGINLIII